MQTDDPVEQYRILRPKYEAFTAKLERLLRDLLQSEGIKFQQIESRAKGIENFQEKIARKGYPEPLKDMTDLSGLRIVLDCLADVRRVTNIVERQFFIDREHSIDKQEVLEPDKFTYISIHKVVKLSDDRKKLPEWKEFTDFFAEIQISTILQHAWASVQRFVEYKTEFDAPKPLRRRLHRLIALFELADQELDCIIAERKKYVQKMEEIISSKEKDIELNMDTYAVYLEISETVRNWISIAQSIGLQIDLGKIPSKESASNVIDVCRKLGVKTISELESLLIKANDKELRAFADLLQRLNVHPFLNKSIIVKLLLIGFHPRRLSLPHG